MQLSFIAHQTVKIKKTTRNNPEGYSRTPKFVGEGLGVRGIRLQSSGFGFKTLVLNLDIQICSCGFIKNVAFNVNKIKLIAHTHI